MNVPIFLSLALSRTQPTHATVPQEYVFNFFSNIHPNVSFLGHFDPLFLFSSSHPLFLACLFPTLSRVWHAVVSQAPELDIAKETEVDFVPGG